MRKHDTEYLDLPITTDGRNELLDLEDHPDHPFIQNIGDVVQVDLLVDEQLQRAGVKKPRADHPYIQNRGNVVYNYILVDDQVKRAEVKKSRVGNLEKLKVVFVLYMKKKSTQLLEFQVEQFLKSKGHLILLHPHVAHNFSQLKYSG